MIVWVLVFFFYGHAVVVDNISARTNCKALGREMVRDFLGSSYFACYGIRKALPHE